jgi:hypothetical protein
MLCIVVLLGWYYCVWGNYCHYFFFLRLRSWRQILSPKRSFDFQHLKLLSARNIFIKFIYFLFFFFFHVWVSCSGILKFYLTGLVQILFLHVVCVWFMCVILHHVLFSEYPAYVHRLSLFLNPFNNTFASTMSGHWKQGLHLEKVCNRKIAWLSPW